MLGLRGHKYQQTCHSPGEKNLNGYEKKSEYHGSPPPPSHILSVPNGKYSSGTNTSPPSRYRSVDISTVQKKTTTYSLQVKGLYHRAGTDHLKWLKIKNQLRKWLKRTIVTAEGGIPFRGVWEHVRQEKF